MLSRRRWSTLQNPPKPTLVRTISFRSIAQSLNSTTPKCASWSQVYGHQACNGPGAKAGGSCHPPMCKAGATHWVIMRCQHRYQEASEDRKEAGSKSQVSVGAKQVRGSEQTTAGQKDHLEKDQHERTRERCRSQIDSQEADRESQSHHCEQIGRGCDRAFAAGVSDAGKEIVARRA